MSHPSEEELEELRRLAAKGRQLEDAETAAAEAHKKEREAAAEHDRTVVAVRAALRQDRAEAAARFKKTLKDAAGVALAAGLVAGYAVLVGEAWSEMGS